MTLVELSIVVVILATLATLGMALYGSAVRSARIAKAIQEIKMISTAVDTFRSRSATFGLPVSLDEVGHGDRLDPWGNVYMYLNFSTGTGSGMQFVLANGLIDPAAVTQGRNVARQSRRLPPPPPMLEVAEVGALKRKDRFLFPLNSDYDLFSLGPNGKAYAGIVSEFSLDDVIRANDGAFFGRASDY